MARKKSTFPIKSVKVEIRMTTLQKEQLENAAKMAGNNTSTWMLETLLSHINQSGQ